MHSNIASAAAKPAGAALPASADSQSRAEHVFGDMRRFFDTHAKFSAVVRLRNSSRECSPRASGARPKNQPNQCEAERIQAPGDVQGLDQWSDSFWMSKGSKHLFSKILNCTDVELPKAIVFPVEGLVGYLGRAGFDLEKFCLLNFPGGKRLDSVQLMLGYGRYFACSLACSSDMLVGRQLPPVNGKSCSHDVYLGLGALSF